VEIQQDRELRSTSSMQVGRAVGAA
jgi:hypothetical protein